MFIAAHLPHLPLDEFVTLEDKLLPLLASRTLALEWRVTPDLDLSEVPRNCPNFHGIAGFGLIRTSPVLWERLGELGPRAAELTARFLAKDGELAPLVAARERFREKGMWAD
jgi:hypothetical protein